MKDLQTEKTCRKCGHTKPVNEFFFRGQGATQLLYTSNCKPCERLRKHERLVAKGAKMPNRIHLDPTGIMVKKCTLCHTEKSVDQFNTGFHKQAEKPYMQSRCKTCEGAVLRRRISEMTPEEDAERRRKNRERCRKHADKRLLWRQQNRGRLLANSVEWRRKNPGKHAEHEARRRQRKRDAGLEIIDRQAIIARDNATCYLCGKFVAVDEIHLDHVIPILHGGSDSPENIKVSCEPCNLRKHTNIVEPMAYA